MRRLSFGNSLPLTKVTNVSDLKHYVQVGHLAKLAPGKDSAQGPNPSIESQMEALSMISWVAVKDLI